MEEQRMILEQLIDSGTDYSEIVMQSQKLDEYIVNFMREGIVNGQA